MRRQLQKGMMTFDCVILVDCHLSRSAERRLYSILDVHSDSEISTGIILLNHGWRASSWFRSTAAQRRLREGYVAWLDPTLPCQTDLVLVLSPSLSMFEQNRPLRLQASKTIVWPIEAALDEAAGDAKKLRDQISRLQTVLNAPVSWMARSDVEQHFLAEKLASNALHPEIWWPLILPESSKEPTSLKCKGLVGRHFGQGTNLDDAGTAEWQDAWRERWPLPLAILCDSEFSQSLPPIAPGQEIQFDDWSKRKLYDFLAGLDLFVATGECRNPARVHEEILEAMAAGLPVIATPEISERFEQALPSSEACFLGDLAWRLLNDASGYDKVRKDQAALFQKRYDADAYRDRMSRVSKKAKAEQTFIWSGVARQPGHILFISDDSPYLEHLPRQLAIARHLPTPLTPYFLSMAKDTSLVEHLGYPFEYLLPHTSKTYRAVFDDAEAWNLSLARHLRELVYFLDAKAVIFDGVFPFAGLVDLCVEYPSLPCVWIRRGLWQAGAEEDGLMRSGLFDLVIEPDDLAKSFDQGPTKKHNQRVLPTAPIVFGQRRRADRARVELDVQREQPAVFLRPTISTDQHTGETMRVLLRELADGGCRFWTTSVVPSGNTPSWPVETVRLDSLSARRNFGAFDLVISGADYQSVHENAVAGIPSVFLPDQSKPTDDQVTRAATAARDGWAIALTRGDVYGARDAARRMLDPEERQMMSRLCRVKEATGAEEAALMIAQMVYAIDMTPPIVWRRRTST